MSTRFEEFHVTGDDLLKKVKSLVAESNVRRIIIKNKEGKTILEIPLTVGLIGSLLAPMLAAVGAVAALVSECTISVQRET
jgi:hypothetical protein